MTIDTEATTVLVPLHTRSHYSLGHGTTPIARLVDRAAAVGLPALALTDVENLYGQVIFHRLAREKGIHPVTGVELVGPLSIPPAAQAIPTDPAEGLGPPPGCAPAHDSRLVLLARDRTGYENLCRIITRRKLHASFRDPIESLRDRLDGLYVLASEPLVIERLLALPGIDRDAVRLLLARPPHSATAERNVVDASFRFSIPLVADPDIVYLDPEDRVLHCLQRAIGENGLISRMAAEVPEHGRHFPGPRECDALFADVPEAVRETRRIADGCCLDLRKSRPVFPRIPLPPGETAYSHLAKLAFRGLERRFSRISARHMERLVSELHVIEQLGFCEYFIVVGDIVRFAHDHGIEVVGRGSGAGSLVAHVLGVTNVDPIEHRLYFERFLHEGRSDLPDIDIDICWIRRDEVIDHVYRTYGDDRVAMISSHVTFQPHMAFREALKAFGMPIEEVNRWSRRIPYIHPDIKSRTPIRDLILSSPLSRDIPLDEEPFRTAVPLAERLLDHPHHLSVHPGGIVIGDRDIDAYAPLERAAKGIVVTQYDMYSIEEVGLVKIDLLGNRCLTELQETLELARAPAGAPPPAGGGALASLAEIPDADPDTIELIRSARTIGCFQLESPAMRSLLARMRAQDIRDCIAAVAIIRPGAAAGGAKDAFIRRRSGEEPPEYLHPSLRKVLEDSLGIVIYEEDVMCIASAIAGVSLAEGDRLRSALKKCRHPDDARDLENDFLRRAVSSGIEPDVARAVWQDLRKFSAYCFSKAHAAGYGVLAYQSAYLKTHFPAEFGCALLNNHAGMYSTRTIAEEVKRMGVRILHPSVSGSQTRFSVEPDPGSPRRAIRTGLGRVKGLAAVSIDAILEARQGGGAFRSFADFLRRAPIPARDVEALILAGAFHDLPVPRGLDAPPNHPQLLWELESRRHPGSRPVDERPARKGASNGSALPHAGQQAWLVLEGECPGYPELPPFDPMACIQNEIRILEMALTDHPLRLLREEARRGGILTALEATSRIGEKVRVAGILAATRKVRTAKGSLMQFLTIEDESGLLEATLFPRIYQACSGRIRSLGPYVIEGKIEEDHGAVNLNVAHIEAWSARSLSMGPLPQPPGPGYDLVP